MGNLSSERPLVSIYTCVYNMADKIHRALNSVKKQTYTNIEHIIIDDGSTDCLDSIVTDYIHSVGYPVIYIKKENGGKHTATNIAFTRAKGEYLIQLDADDELLPNAVDCFWEIWESIPNSEEYWCVSCATRNQFSEKMVGTPFPKNINHLIGEERNKAIAMGSGEKVGCMRRDIMCQYSFAEPIAVKFVSESWLWDKIEKNWKTWYTNDILRIYYINEGESLSRPRKNRQHFSNVNWICREEINGNKVVGIKKMLYYAMTYHLTTVIYRNEYRYIQESWNSLTKIVLFLLKVPSKLVAFIYSIKHFKSLQ